MLGFSSDIGVLFLFVDGRCDGRVKGYGLCDTEIMKDSDDEKRAV